MPGCCCGGCQVCQPGQTTNFQCCSAQGQTADCQTQTGTTNYQTCSGGNSCSSTGSVINTSANPVTSNSGPVDASGGNGSFPTGLQNIMTQGLNDAAISATEFGLGSLTCILRVGANGQTTAASAPSAATNRANAPVPSAGPLGIPWLGWLVVGGVALFLLRKKL